jgi:hypothetical protein
MLVFGWRTWMRRIGFLIVVLAGALVLHDLGGKLVAWNGPEGIGGEGVTATVLAHSDPSREPVMSRFARLKLFYTLGE